MAREARAAGVPAHVISTELEGEAREIGRMLAELAGETARGEAAPPRLPACSSGAGARATVSLADGGEFGTGGPNQEAALAAALALADGTVRLGVLPRHRRLRRRHRGGRAPIVDGLTARRAADVRIDLEAALGAPPLRGGARGAR